MKDKLLNALYEISNEHSNLIFLMRTTYGKKRDSVLAIGRRADEKKLYEITVNHLLSKFTYDELNITINESRLIFVNESLTNNGFIFYNSDSASSDVTHKIIFKSLYPNILLRLYKNNFVWFNNKLYGSIIINIIELMDSMKSEIFKTENDLNIEDYLVHSILKENTWYLLKFIINFTYYISLFSDNFKLNNHHLIARYTKEIFEDLIKKHYINVLSIYIDEIDIYQPSETIDDIINKLELPYEVVNFKKNE